MIKKVYFKIRSIGKHLGYVFDGISMDNNHFV